MFEEEAIVEWYKNLKGKEKEFVRYITKRIRERDSTLSPMKVLIEARKAVILRNAIGLIGYMELKTPRQVCKELAGS